MSNMNTQEKENLLEQAVRVIEQDILAVQGYFASESTSMALMPMYTLEIEDIELEVDLLMLVEHEGNNDLVFICDCHNQHDFVSGKMIAYFEHKIQTYKATKGFYIGKEFAPEAYELAAKNPQIVLIETLECFDVLRKIGPTAAIHAHIGNPVVGLIGTTDQNELIDLNMADLSVHMEKAGVETFEDLLDELFGLNDIIQNEIERVTNNRDQGAHEFCERFSYDIISDFIVNDKRIVKIGMQLQFDHYYTEAIIYSFYGQESKKRIIFQELNNFNGEAYNIHPSQGN